MNNEIRYIPGWRKIFLAHLKNGYNESMSAHAAGVGSADISREKRKDKEFEKQMEDAKRISKKRVQF